MSFVTTEIQDAVAVLTIDRPKALNALNPEVLADLKAAFEAIDQNTVRCVVLTGAGDKSFVAGADIGSMSTMTKAEGEAFGKLGNDVFLMIESFPLPVIAAVNGFALGGGNELAMSCDIRLCSDNAVFGQPEVGLGITPGFGGTQRLARLVGMGMAKQLVYSALNIKADGGPAHWSGQRRLHAGGADARCAEAGRQDRQECSHCGPQLQEGHQRRHQPAH